MTQTDISLPAPRMTQEERVERSESLMLEAATDLIIERGTQNTTLKDIGERAGYSRGLANARFGSKEALLVRLSDTHRGVWLRSLKRAAQGKTGLAALLSRIEASRAFARKHPREARVMYTLWFESVGTSSEINDSLRRFHDAARNDIAGLALEAGLFDGEGAERDAKHFGVRFCATMFGLSYQWLVDGDAFDLVNLMDELEKEVLKLAKRP
ncbi:MAG: helix-turn-helix domain-containing protein [Pseudomonadota bacterium]